jgi:bifunctional non-homologous end joining protein LigD
MSLEEYRKKRRFAETPEPRGIARRPSGRGRRPIFVVQKHAASRLHYDFRLEINGVLKSWAVPKGPSMNPADKRLAVMTEDHPLEYADFEGVIPKGQYGAGTVMIWDRGPYESQDRSSLEEQLTRGKIDVILNGHKLRGGFTLLNTGPRAAVGRRASWLLVKHRDKHAEPMWDVEAPALSRSVVSGKTLKEIAQRRAPRNR